MKSETPRTDSVLLKAVKGEVEHSGMAAMTDHARQLERELNDLRKTAAIVADWLERSRQINPADMVSRNMDLAKELRRAAMPNKSNEPH